MLNIGTHKNIVSIIGTGFEENVPLLVVEYCPLGDLQAYLRKVSNIQSGFMVDLHKG